MSKKITACHECAVGIANDDWTSLDYHYGDDADDVMAIIDKNLSRFGWLTHTSEKEVDHFECEICEEPSYKLQHTFTAQ